MVEVFISQPMHGLSDEEIVAVRKDALARVTELYSSNGEEVHEIRSYFGDTGRRQLTPLECLGKAIELMSHADVVVFAEGWEKARGCRIEHECAVQYGLEVIELL